MSRLPSQETGRNSMWKNSFGKDRNPSSTRDEEK